MHYEKIEVRPLTGVMGAEIEGVDLSKPMDNQTRSEVFQAFLDHVMIYFRDQELTAEQQLSFTECWGAHGETPFIDTMAEHSNIIKVVKEADEESPAVFGGGWHSDFSFLDTPPMATILYALDVPDVGGDTMYSNNYAVYEGLSDGMKALLGGMTGIYSARGPYGPQAQAHSDQMASMTIRNSEEAYKTKEHPLVRTVPENGRKALFASRSYLVGIKGFKPEEAKPIVDFINEIAVRPAVTCRLKWERGTLAMWDNRAAQHCALGDYHGSRREMHRTTVAGEIPSP